jgi:hypothetical protein
MSLKVKITVSSTDFPEYKEVIFGTFEVEFNLEDLLKAEPDGYVWDKLIQRRAGITTDNRLAWLDAISIVPVMHFGPSIKLKEL